MKGIYLGIVWEIFGDLIKGRYHFSGDEIRCRRYSFKNTLSSMGQMRIVHPFSFNIRGWHVLLLFAYTRYLRRDKTLSDDQVQYHMLRNRLHACPFTGDPTTVRGRYWTNGKMIYFTKKKDANRYVRHVAHKKP